MDYQLREVKETYFNPKLPPDLVDLPVIIIHRGYGDFVEWVGFRAFPGSVRVPIKQVIDGEERVTGHPYKGGDKVEQVVDINGPAALAQKALDDLVVPKIRELFARPVMVPMDVSHLVLRPVAPSVPVASLHEDNGIQNGEKIVEIAPEPVKPERKKPGRKPKAKPAAIEQGAGLAEIEQV